MKIPTKDVPQADVLLDVIKTVILVSENKRTDLEIGNGIGKSARQGRYYRRSAEILGLITNKQNNSTLTKLGEHFINTGADINNPIILDSILKIRIFQRVIAFLDNFPEGVNRIRITNYLKEVTQETEETMLPRRVSSIISWLQTMDLLIQKDKKYHLTRSLNEKLPILDFTDSDEPILPKSGELSEYQVVSDRFSIAKEEIIIYKDKTNLERSNNAHQHLINLVASKIRNSGALPRSNQIIDLAARINNQDYIFEMKSITETNVKLQIRKGLSQLYEYRYIQNLPNAKLVLVIERKLYNNTSWFQDYLQDDREILLLWDGNGKLYSDNNVKKELSFLW